MQHVLRSYAQLCNALCMTASIVPIPQWDLTDRMAKSLRTAGLSVSDMADYFEVHRNTVSGWIHGRIRPDTRTLRLWAQRTGVPYEWLRYGETPDTGGGGQQTPIAPSPLFLAPQSRSQSDVMDSKRTGEILSLGEAA